FFELALSDPLSKRFSRRQVHLAVDRFQNHAVNVARRLHGHQPVMDVFFYQLRVSLQRISVPSAASDSHIEHVIVAEFEIAVAESLWLTADFGDLHRTLVFFQLFIGRGFLQWHHEARSSRITAEYTVTRISGRRHAVGDASELFLRSVMQHMSRLNPGAAAKFSGARAIAGMAAK